MYPSASTTEHFRGNKGKFKNQDVLREKWVHRSWSDFIELHSLSLFSFFKDVFSFFLRLYVFWPCGISVAVLDFL